jgi:hypothetical protein
MNMGQVWSNGNKGSEENDSETASVSPRRTAPVIPEELKAEGGGESERKGASLPRHAAETAVPPNLQAPAPTSSPAADASTEEITKTGLPLDGLETERAAREAALQTFSRFSPLLNALAVQGDAWCEESVDSSVPRWQSGAALIALTLGLRAIHHRLVEKSYDGRVGSKVELRRGSRDAPA